MSERWRRKTRKGKKRKRYENNRKKIKSIEKRTEKKKFVWKHTEIGKSIYLLPDTVTKWKEGGGFFLRTADNNEGIEGGSQPNDKAVTYCDLLYIL